jgi:hypothetical protein
VFGIVGDTRAPAQSPSVPLGVLNRIWLDLMPAFLAYPRRVSGGIGGSPGNAVTLGQLLERSGAADRELLKPISRTRAAAALPSVIGGPGSDFILEQYQSRRSLPRFFALDPRTVGQIDWLFSDVSCYPPRLLALVEPGAQIVRLAGEEDLCSPCSGSVSLVTKLRTVRS